MAFHIILSGFALSAAALHWYLQKEMVAMSMNALNVPKITLALASPVFLAIGFTHFVGLVRVLRHSHEAGRLVLHATNSKRKASSSLPLVRPILQLYDQLTEMWGKLFSPTGFFGFSNPHFETVFMLREAWEILLQTYQAYQLSLSVPRKWINQLAVATIVINCCSSPLVHLFLRKRSGHRRVFNLVQDAILDFCCSIIIPLSIFLPYVPLYDTTYYQFPDELMLNDVWFINAIAEIRQVLVTSFPDFVSTMMPQLSLLGYLMTFKNLLRRRSPRVLRSPNGPSIANPPVGLVPQRTMRPSSLEPSPSFEERATQQSRRPRKKCGKALSIIMHIAFVLWGFGVLGLHIDAFHNTDRRIPGCQLHVSAWHSSRFPCSVMQLNCHAERIEGSAQEISRVLELLDRWSLRALVFSHCPAFHMPPVVTEFNMLAGIELFNCTLVDWPVEASIRDATQPTIGYIFLILTNWTTFPAGLLNDELPKPMTHLAIFGSNMTAFPEEVSVWSVKSWIGFYIAEAPNLHVLPDAFCQIEMGQLYVINTGVKVLPDACLENAGLFDLEVTGTALSSLPTAVGSKLQILYAENTDIDTLPTWFEDWYHQGPTKDVAFYGSPICTSPVLQENHSMWNEVCGTDRQTNATYYPWDIMIRLRPYDVSAAPPPPI